MKNRFTLTYSYVFILCAFLIFFENYILGDLLSGYYPTIGLSAFLLSLNCVISIVVAGLVCRLFNKKRIFTVFTISVLVGIGVGYLITSPDLLESEYWTLFFFNCSNAMFATAFVCTLILVTVKIKKEVKSDDNEISVYSGTLIFFYISLMGTVLLISISLIYSEMIGYISKEDFFIAYLFIILFLLFSALGYGACVFRKKDRVLSAICSLLACLLIVISTSLFVCFVNSEYNLDSANYRREKIRKGYQENTYSVTAMEEETIDNSNDESNDESNGEEDDSNSEFETNTISLESIWPKEVKKPNINKALGFYRNHYSRFDLSEDFLPKAPFSYLNDSLSLEGIPDSKWYSESAIDFYQIVSFLSENRNDINFYELFNAYRQSLFAVYKEANLEQQKRDLNVCLAAYHDLSREDKFEEVYNLMLKTATPFKSGGGLKQYKALQPYISRSNYYTFTYNERSYNPKIYVKAYSFWGRRWKEGNIQDCYQILSELQDHFNEIKDEND